MFTSLLSGFVVEVLGSLIFPFLLRKIFPLFQRWNKMESCRQKRRAEIEASGGVRADQKENESAGKKRGER